MNFFFKIGKKLIHAYVYDKLGIVIYMCIFQDIELKRSLFWKEVRLFCPKIKERKERYDESNKSITEWRMKTIFYMQIAECRWDRERIFPPWIAAGSKNDNMQSDAMIKHSIKLVDFGCEYGGRSSASTFHRLVC